MDQKELPIQKLGVSKPQNLMNVQYLVSKATTTSKTF